MILIISSKKLKVYKVSRGVSNAETFYGVWDLKLFGLGLLITLSLFRLNFYIIFVFHSLRNNYS